MAIASLALLNPEFRATSVIALDAPSSATGSAIPGPIQTEASLVQGQVEVLRSTALLGQVCDKLKLDLDPEFTARPIALLQRAFDLLHSVKWPAMDKREASQPVRLPEEASTRDRAISNLARRLRTTTLEQSLAISVSSWSVDASKARTIVDAVVELYFSNLQEARSQAEAQAKQAYGERLDALKADAEAADQAVVSFQQKSGITSSKDSIATHSLAELNSQLVQAKAQRAERESRLVALQEAQSNPSALGGVSEVFGNPLIASLRAQEAEVARRIGEFSQRYGASHPRMLQARAEQGQIQSRINIEVNKILAGLQNDAQAARSKEAELQAQVSALEKESTALAPTEAEYQQLRLRAQTSKAVYEQFAKRVAELEALDVSRPGAHVVSRASLPVESDFPPYGPVMLCALTLGLGLAIGFGILKDRLARGYRSADQIERETGLAVIGMIPALSRRSQVTETPALFAVAKPRSAYAEALRSAHTTIMLDNPSMPPKVVLVTSSLPDEGKSTFAGSLAGLIARSSPEKRVILLDCDLRRSSVAKSIGISQPAGTLDEFLSGAKTLSEVLGREPRSGLFYIAARADTPNSGEILGYPKMRDLVGSLSKAFDLVILDTPPLLAVADPRVLLGYADYIAFVVRWEKTARDAVMNSLKLLRVSGRPVGMVLSQVDVERHARYGYGDMGSYYSKYRNYYTE